MKKEILLLIILFNFFCLNSQNKIPLNHEVYENWKEVINHRISHDGRYVSFEVNPQKGFAAMRRLNKPAWMLTYNDEEHNLSRWPNRIDLDIRMMQFFNHFLNAEKIPERMEKGVPALKKNTVTGRDLLE